MTRPLAWRLWRKLVAVERWCLDYVRLNEPRTLLVLTPLLLVALLLYTRHPETNYIFDEQEALLANPYVNGAQGLKFSDVIYRDFWGLPPDASIGSYRPLPDVIWRALWSVHYYLPEKWAHLPKHPFFHHLFNIVLHAVNGALLASFTWAATRRRLLAWLAGLLFVACALLTEAVSGIVGIADVLGGLGAIAALHALRLPAAAMPFGVFVAVLVGMFSKESALVCVPLVPLVALLLAPYLHVQRPARAARALLAFAGALAAFVLYVELRKDWFPSPLPEALSQPLPDGTGRLARLLRDFMVWFHQAPLPKDPLNNPLADADFPHRVAGALRVYWRGLGQVVLPWRLSGDYSFPQEPVPKSLFEWESVAGGVMMVGPLLLGPVLWLLALARERRDRRQLVPAASVLGEALGAIARGPRKRPLALPLVQLPPRAARPRQRAVGIALLVAALAGLGTELVMIRRGDAGGVRTWPWVGAVLVAGIGLLVGACRPVERPMQSPGPWPWRHVAPVLGAIAMLWVVVAYFPHSNIPVLLPTVRAERFWYFPVIGSSLGLAVLFAWVADRFAGRRLLGTDVPVTVIGLFVGFQCLRAFSHAMDYRDDLTFWRATRDAVPRSAKAHLNYSVMEGARGRLGIRLEESKIALALAPEWPMAHIYLGDTLCRLHRAPEAWPHYVAGFAIGPNDRALIALALQCLYDEQELNRHDAELRAYVTSHPRTWIAFLGADTLDNQATYGGVDPKYRPRGYNQGPKE